jgi:hypothetical protein
VSATLLTPSVIAKEALHQLDNNLVASKLVYRAYESEFGDTKIGDTITIRKPVKFAVRNGPVAQMQDAVEGKTQIKIDTQQGSDLRFPTKDLTLTIDAFSERYLKHPMIALANQVDLAVLQLYKTVWNYTIKSGSPNPTKVIGGYADFMPAAQRLDEMAVPAPRVGVISPANFYGIAGSFTGVYQPELVKDALTKSKLPMVGNMDIYSSQNVAVHSSSAQTLAMQVSATAQTLAADYATTKDTNTFSLLTFNWGSSSLLSAGSVFTIAGVYAVNPVTKQALPYLQQFVLTADVTANATTGSDTSITFSPAPIPSGPYQNVSAAPVANAAITWLAGSSGYSNVSQNLVFAPNAFALCMVPMELPEGAAKKARESYKGLSVRVVCDYDIINDINMWRLDILYGVKSIYPDLATRHCGTT